MGPRSDFSKPCQGAAEKSANATRCCCLARGSQCVGMSTKKDAARPFGLGTFFVVGGTELEQHGHAAGGVTNTPVGCLLVRGSQCVGMSTKKDAARPFGQGLFSAPSTNPRQSRTRTASVFPARFFIAFHRKVCFNKKSDTAIRRREKVGAGCSKLRS